jgi:hypothetical protein
LFNRNKNIFENIPLATSLVTTAMTLIYDLGLHRPPPKEPPYRTAFESAIRNSARIPFKLIVRSADEKRAVLACFLLSSV